MPRRPRAERVRATVRRAGVRAVTTLSNRRAQRSVVAHARYQPFAGLPEWLSSRSDDDAFVANIRELEYQVGEHKVFDIREPTLVEHRRGNAFLRSGLIRESMTRWELTTGPTPKGYRDYLLWLARLAPPTNFSEAVSMRARLEGNFWHFQNSTLRKLLALDELDLAPDVPLLVGRPLWESRAFAEARALPAFRARNWVLHDRPVRCDRLVIVLEGSYRRANMSAAHETLETFELSDAIAPPPHPEPIRSHPASDLFVVADQPEIEQHLENEREIAQALAPHGFAAFHAEHLSLHDRVQRVRAARCVVMPAGAGVASLVHRIGLPTGVVEILPSDKERAEPYGAWFCREFGFAYRAVVGTAVSPGAGFTVAADPVIRAVHDVLHERTGAGTSDRNRPALVVPSPTAT